MKSEIKFLCEVEFPAFTGLRVMMMPFLAHDLSTLPIDQYHPIVAKMLRKHGGAEGTGYITIDEAFVRAGETHRRPGLHVDGMGGWSRPAPWASCGMLVAANRAGSIGWNQEVYGEPGEDGNCEHLRDELEPDCRVYMYGGMAFACSPMAVHTAVPAYIDGQRQFLRISLPNGAPWYEGYTPNPLGIIPAGPILPRRTQQMEYRP